jgi:2-polyprenyl-6-methoxyphenol hydroxylase-like FAD-dependent oxidoreductase
VSASVRTDGGLGTEVFIAGAGPTGLLLALWLRRLGRSVRIVDRAAAPGTTSRAIAVQARTLEHYRQLGVADQILARGLKFGAANLWAGGASLARVVLGDLGATLSRFPYVLSYPQDEHERLLVDLLAREGVAVERQVEVTGFLQTDGGVRVELRHADGTIWTAAAGYLAGCDGAHSAVRARLGTGFAGGTYEHLFYVADVRARGPMMNGDLHVALDDDDFLAVFPLAPGAEGEEPRARLIGTVRAGAQPAPGAEPGAAARDLSWDDVSPELMRRLRIEVGEVRWFSTYRVHHRVADRFRRGRVFLLGDAAHIHSPVGGQGMNTGLGDAVNLAWKLAAVLDGRADDALLDSYEPERIAFARRLVATTDRAFTAATSPTRWARWVRLRLIPWLLPPLSGLAAARRLAFRTVSQIGIHYRGSPLSAGRAGRVRAGDRLPWIRLAGAPPGAADDNHAALDLLDWQAHVYGRASPALEAACQRRALPLRVFELPGARQHRSGLLRDALYLVRPDGHVAWADEKADAGALERFLDRHRLRARAQSKNLRSEWKVG